MIALAALLLVQRLAILTNFQYTLTFNLVTILMTWLLLLVTLSFVVLFYLIEYIKAKKKFSQMTAVEGQLLSYQLNAKSKRVNPYDMHRTNWDIESMFTSPKVLYSFEFNGLNYQSARLSLLGAIKMNLLNVYILPKPIPVIVYVNPEDPNDATLHLGQFSRPKFARVAFSVLFIAYTTFKYASE